MGKTAIAGLVGFLLCGVPGRSQERRSPVGSAVCATCHKKLYDDFTRTAMGRSMSLVASQFQKPAPVTIFSEKLNRYFAVFRDGASLYQSQYELDAAGKEVFRAAYKLEYAIGSGVNGYS